MRANFAWALLVISAAVAGCAPRPVDVSVVLQDYGFDPSVIEVPAGAQVTITVDNRGHHEHYWALVEKDYTVTLPFDDEDTRHLLAIVAADMGAEATITFDAPSVRGEYVVVCSIPGHAEKGMVGTFIVK